MDRGVRRAGAAVGTDRETVSVIQTQIVSEMEELQRHRPRASMPGCFPRRGRSPGVELVPGVGGASLRGVGVLDFRPGVEDLSFC